MCRVWWRCVCTHLRGALKFGKNSGKVHSSLTWATLQGHAEASGPEAARLWQSLIVDEFNLAQKQNYQPIDDLRGRWEIPTSSSHRYSRPLASHRNMCVGYVSVSDTYQLVYRVRLVTRHRVALAFGLVA